VTLAEMVVGILIGGGIVVSLLPAILDRKGSK